MGVPKRFPDRDEAVRVREEAETLDAGQEGEERRRVAGRVLARRGHGKLTFLDLVDRSGRVQLLCAADRCGPIDVNLGDIVGASGFPARTRRGEPSLAVDALEVLAPTRRPLPDTFHGLVDTETRYRKRYLDLLVNEETRHDFMLRSRLVAAIRRYLDERGFIEVETPVLQPRYGGAFAAPFTTHHNELGADLYLRIATELYLKRLIVGGLEKVYEIGKDFRNEGVSYKHNPEFTMLEWYEAYADYSDTMGRIEDLIETAAVETIGTTQVNFRGMEFDLKAPWRRVKLVDALGEHGLWTHDEEELRTRLDAAGVETDKDRTWAQLVDHALSHFVEPALVEPTILHDYPIELSPFARATDDDPTIVERFEYFVGGMELGNAFTEINDADEQAERFGLQQSEKASGDLLAEEGDPDYVEALSYGMPPTSGIGLGIDRLAMILTGRESIRDVVLFPALAERPRLVDLALPDRWGYGPITALRTPSWWNEVVVPHAGDLLSQWAALGKEKAFELAIREADFLGSDLEFGPFAPEWHEFTKSQAPASVTRLLGALAASADMSDRVKRLRIDSVFGQEQGWPTYAAQSASNGIALLSLVRTGLSREAGLVLERFLGEHGHRLDK